MIESLYNYNYKTSNILYSMAESVQCTWEHNTDTNDADGEVLFLLKRLQHLASSVKHHT